MASGGGDKKKGKDESYFPPFCFCRYVGRLALVSREGKFVVNGGENEKKKQKKQVKNEFFKDSTEG